jgi:hypothetical protein
MDAPSLFRVRRNPQGLRFRALEILIVPRPSGST